ncbi:MAG TPA: UDP-N-acetylmuramate--L-alanine ligase [Vicinamibacterales bacterium]|nr:UDP-N-acetylmuramate--L-alanine ligase [Vicinamibacterales bacterium]
MLGATKRIHFVGIGGIGMSGIAELLANLGFEVSGSDVKRSAVATRLAEKFGVRVHEGHRAEHVGDAQVVVVSSAVRPSNPEVVEAARRGIPVIPRAEMLAELMRLRFSIAVAGSHGKTTTTSMIAVVLERAGVDPTAVIGGRLSAFGSNARLGRGEYLVAEADESDRSFLVLYPTIAVLTNIDREHMESYGSFEDLQQAFADFANKVPFYGSVVACADDPAVVSILPRINRPLVTYGLEGRVRRAGNEAPEGERRKGVHIEASDVEIGAFGGRCVVHAGDRDRRERLGELRLAIPGRHNLQNALAAVAVADRLGLPFADVASALADFHGAERRFERHGEADGVLVVDDYGHHPTEIAAVLAAARATLGRRLVVAFQPHRYTRTQQLMEAFGPALREADEIVLTDIYSASEEPIAGVTLDALAGAVRAGSGRPVHVARRLDEVIPAILDIARPGDAVLTLGAGSIGSLPAQLVEALTKRRGAAR